jgi:hypothetical protein
MVVQLPYRRPSRWTPYGTVTVRVCAVLIGALRLYFITITLHSCKFGFSISILHSNLLGSAQPRPWTIRIVPKCTADAQPHALDITSILIYPSLPLTAMLDVFLSLDTIYSTFFTFFAYL